MISGLRSFPKYYFQSLGRPWKCPFLIVLAISILVLEFENTKLIAEMQDWSLDLFFRSRHTAEYLFDDIQIVVITDSDYRNPSLFNSHSPLCPRRVVDLMDRTSELSPAVIGVDLDTKDPDWYSQPECQVTNHLPRFLLEPTPGLKSSFPKCQVEDESDASTPNAKLPAQVPIVWAQLPVEGAGDQSGDRPIQLYQILGGCQDYQQAFAGVPRFPLDPDGVVRRYLWQFRLDAQNSNKAPDTQKSDSANRPDCTTDSSAQASTICAFARVIAEKYTDGLPQGDVRDSCKLNLERSKNEKEKILNFSGDVQFCKVDVASLYDPRKRDAARCNHKTNPVLRKIVLIGGEFEDARDSYDTPTKKMSGVELNALAIESELHGGTIAEAPRPCRILTDVASGTLFVFIFWLIEHSVHRRKLLLFVVGTVTTIAIALLLSWTLFRCHVWLSVIPILIGTNIHQYLEHAKLFRSRKDD